MKARFLIAKTIIQRLFGSLSLLSACIYPLLSGDTTRKPEVHSIPESMPSSAHPSCSRFKKGFLKKLSWKKESLVSCRAPDPRGLAEMDKTCGLQGSMSYFAWLITVHLKLDNS